MFMGWDTAEEKHESLVVGERRFAVKLHLSIRHHCNINSLVEKLHDLFSLPCQLRPARSRFRILFETTQFVTFKLKIHFPQS